jgi:hypothetical protein
MFEQANQGSTNNRNKRSRKEVVINKEWFVGEEKEWMSAATSQAHNYLPEQMYRRRVFIRL